ncbi:MAG: hypothetical protein AAGJ52_07995 [Pseudomonadota bacterium]
MTILMLQELNEAQKGALEAQSEEEPVSEKKDNPWEPERRPSQPAVRPWWQRHVPGEEEAVREGVELLWGRGCVRRSNP